MSIAGFRAQNHPQQVGKGGAKDAVDDRGTTPEVFGPLNERFDFDPRRRGLPDKHEVRALLHPRGRRPDTALEGRVGVV